MSKDVNDIGVVTSKGQTTIPKRVRDLLGLEPGAQLEWTVENGQAIVKPRTLRLADLAGILGNPLGRSVTIEEMDQAIAEGVAERFRRAVDRS